MKTSDDLAQNERKDWTRRYGALKLSHKNTFEKAFKPQSEQARRQRLDYPAWRTR